MKDPDAEIAMRLAMDIIGELKKNEAADDIIVAMTALGIATGVMARDSKQADMVLPIAVDIAEEIARGPNGGG